MHSYVRSISSGRHWVSTWIVTSSGIRSSSMSRRTKSKSGWLADGNPTSISLKPIATTASNIRRLRTGSIGSISAWLPSRRSTEHQVGAFSMRRLGHCRSGIATGSGTNGVYFSNGIVFGVALGGGIELSSCWFVSTAKKQEPPEPLGRRRFGECLCGTRLGEKEAVVKLDGHQGRGYTRRSSRTNVMSNVPSRRRSSSTRASTCRTSSGSEPYAW